MYSKTYFLLIFCLLLFSNIDAKNLDIANVNMYTEASGYVEVLHDEKEKFSIKNLPLREFKQNDNLALGYVNGAVWSKLTLTNSAKEPKTFLLISPRVNINTIDVFLFRKNTLQKSYTLGNSREIQNNAIKTRFSNLEVTVLPNESVTIVSKLKSKSTIDVNWYIATTDAFLKFLLLDTFFWGLLAGLILALIIYNLSLFKSLRIYSYIAYVFHGIFALTFQFATNGIFYQFGLYQNREIFNSMAWFSVILDVLSLLIFTMLFFNTKENLKRTHKILVYLIVYYFIILVLFLYSFYSPDIIYSIRGITKPIALGTIIFLFVNGFVAYKHNISGSKYYIAGHGLFLFSIFVQQFSGLANFQTNFMNIYIVALGLFADTVFLSLALGEKVTFLKIEKEKNEKLLISQSNFSSIGKTVGNLAHQWKIPIVQLGTLLMQVEAILWKRNNRPNEELAPVITKMKHTLDFMNHTVLELNNFYNNASKKVVFSLEEEINNVINLLSAKTLYSNTSIELVADKEIKIYANKNAFANCCLIIIDNALDEIKKRSIQNGKITITLSEVGQTIVLTFQDNAGGIKITPVDTVFEIFITNKNDGSGMGLSMCKVLIELKLNGTIQAYNTQDGACFTIRLSR